MNEPASALSNGTPVRSAMGRNIIDLTSDDEDLVRALPSRQSQAPHHRDNMNGFAAPRNDQIQQHPYPGDPPMASRQNQFSLPANRLLDNIPSPDLPDNFELPGPAHAFRAEVWGDYILDEAFDDEAITRAFMREIDPQPHVPNLNNSPTPPPPPPPPQIPAHQPAPLPAAIMETRDGCISAVELLFPGICKIHVGDLYDKVAQSSEGLVAHILDQIEKGTQYPKAKDTQKNLKRKREVDEDEAAIQKYGSGRRVASINTRPLVRKILSYEFLDTPLVFIDAAIKNAGHCLFQAYRVLEEAHRTFDLAKPPYKKIQRPRAPSREYQDDNLDALIQSSAGNQEHVETLRELQAARKIRIKADVKREVERKLELEEEENTRKAEREGLLSECGCCFGDFPLNRMVHCNSEAMHWFCRACARQTAETEIGNSKYELHCMSMDGCEGGFSLEQRSIFLDETTIIALERNEQEAVLRMAGIENLASCPFCPYAAEYPPVEIDKEFRCQAPDCEKVSCRLCKLESHIPKSCEEHAKDTGLSIRRQIEEAMSAALIRKCNKCGTPFVKEEGCNKMTCTRNGCMNVQCYVCSKSCSYDHFNDQSRGGKAGNCPLFENVAQRHADEVNKAEKEALDRVRAENPEYTEEDLKIKVSEDVLKDEESRKNRDPRAVHAGLGLPPNLHLHHRMHGPWDDEFDAFEDEFDELNDNVVEYLGLAPQRHVAFQVLPLRVPGQGAAQIAGQPQAPVGNEPNPVHNAQRNPKLRQDELLNRYREAAAGHRNRLANMENMQQQLREKQIRVNGAGARARDREAATARLELELGRLINPPVMVNPVQEQRPAIQNPGAANLQDNFRRIRLLGDLRRAAVNSNNPRTPDRPKAPDASRAPPAPVKIDRIIELDQALNRIEQRERAQNALPQLERREALMFGQQRIMDHEQHLQRVKGTIAKAKANAQPRLAPAPRGRAERERLAAAANGVAIRQHQIVERNMARAVAERATRNAVGLAARAQNDRHKEMLIQKIDEDIQLQQERIQRQRERIAGLRMGNGNGGAVGGGNEEVAHAVASASPFNFNPFWDFRDPGGNGALGLDEDDE